MECNKISQNVTECLCLIQEMLRNTESETTECICNDLQTDSGTYISGNILLHSVNCISTFRYIPLITYLHFVTFR